jgi:hypothetical protein
VFDENGDGHNIHPKLNGSQNALIGNDTFKFLGCFFGVDAQRIGTSKN